MLTPGVRAPPFSLPGTTTGDGESAVSRYTLEAALETGPVVVNCYVFDFHPACGKHLCGLSDLAWFTLRDEISVFGISTDRSFSHRAFAAEQSIDFPLLSDSDGSVAEDFGVLYDEFHGHKRIAKRSVFLVDRDQVVRYAWSTDDPVEQPDWTAVTDVLDGIGTISV